MLILELFGVGGAVPHEYSNSIYSTISRPSVGNLICTKHRVEAFLPAQLPEYVTF